MEPFFGDLQPAVSQYGPYLVFVMTLLETCSFVGLLLPAEAAVLLASVLASQGLFSIESVFLATVAGGFLGDQLGYALGRFGGDRASGSDSRVGRIWRQNEVRAHSLFRRQSLLAISAARFVSFVRTLMPWLAGMSKMRYRRFVIYDAIGVVGWACASVTLGYYAGESLDAITEILGFASMILLAVAVVTIFIAFKKRRGRRASKAAHELTTKPLYRVGLTGNIGSGKSTVADVWRKLGAHVVDADVLARQAVAAGTPGLTAIRARFGNNILEPWGDLDRGALRRVVFQDPSARKDLESIVHPEVERLRVEEERKVGNAHGTVVVHMIPLLFENHMEEMFDEIVFVDADEEVREKRLIEKRGLTADEARAMMTSQMSADEKRDRVDHIVENGASLEDLEERATLIWRGIMERACE